MPKETYGVRQLNPPDSEQEMAEAADEPGPQTAPGSEVTAYRLFMLLTLADVAKITRLSPHTIRAKVREGRLQPTRISRRLLFDTDEVVRFLTDAKDRLANDAAPAAVSSAGKAAQK